ncbi:hypothetical protein L6V77_03565 [Myxococcota bacterium]|nr:hypothetical protein [Myxococcota bacterium]
MLLSDLSPPTLRLIAAALQAKARYGMLGPGSIRKLAKHEPGANVEQALAFLGLAGRMEVGADPEPAAT